MIAALFLLLENLGYRLAERRNRKPVLAVELSKLNKENRA